MAEIKDVYSLEFNASQFQSEVDSAIGKIEELSDSIIEGQDATNDLADAQGELTRTLGMEAKGVENLNAKRNVLVETQKKANKETHTGKVVSAELDKTNKQLAVSTGELATKNKSLGSTLVDGARKINSVRRAGMMLGNVFRLLGGLNPFGLLVSFLPTAIGYISDFLGFTKETEQETTALQKATDSIVDSYINETTELNNLFGALNQANKGIGNKAAIIAELQKRYPEYLKNINLEKAGQAELALAYRAVASEIAKKIIAEEKTKLQQESIKQILKLEKERQLQTVKFFDANKKRIESLRRSEQVAIQAGDINRIKAIQDEIASIEADPFGSLNEKGREADKKRFEEINAVIETTKQELTALNATESALIDLLVKSVDVSTLTGSFEVVTQSAEKSNKEIDKSNKQLLEQEKQDIYDRALAMKQAADEFIAYNEMLRNEENERYKNVELQTVDEINKERFDAFKESQDKILAYLETTNDAELNLALAGNEELRNASIQSAINTIKDEKSLKTEIERIDAEFNKRKLNIERQNELKIAKERLKIAKEVMQQQFILGIDTADTQSQIAQLELQIAQLEKPLTDFAENTEDKFKDIRDRTFDLIQSGSDAIFSVLSAQAQAYIQQLDRAADKSKSTLDEIRGNSEDFNARQLEIEKKRLEQVEAERQRAVEKEKAIALIQLTVNSTLAIAKAAAEGGIAAPFTIASTIIALLAGFAQARIAAGNAFYEGSEYIDPDMKYGAGRDKVPARLNRGERVITTDTNKKYWNVLSAVHNNKIPADLLNNFANGYQSGGLMKALQNVGGNDINLSNELGGKSFFVNVNSDNSMLENRLERIENVLSDLPKYMPKTTVTANANGIFKIVEQRQKRAKFINDRTK
jgi:hypothetical protein